MSVQTTAEELLDRGSVGLNTAIQSISYVIMERHSMWGADEFSKEYDEKMEEALQHLLKARTLLNR